MDIEKESELCGIEFEKEWDSFCESYGNKYDKSVAKLFYLKGIRKNQEKIKVYELHVGTIKGIYDNEFNEKSESSYILGNLDGFFECLESDLGEIK